MSRDAVWQHAAELLNEASRTQRRIASLPEASHPANAEEALAIQALLVAQSGEAVAGWKVATNAEGVATWGAIYARDCFASPATVEAARMPLLGIEGEIAFRFTRALPARPAPYSRAEIEAVLEAFPAIEIVDSRFENYAETPAIDRLADRMSNGGMVIGAPATGSKAPTLSEVHVTLERDGLKLADQTGGHSRGDPLLPVIEFIHAVQARQAFRVGEFITAGSFTGLNFGKPGQRFAVTFEGLGAAVVSFTVNASRPNG